MILQPATQATVGLLERLNGACGQDFIRYLHMARYGAQIHLLRGHGYVIDKEVCKRHPHERKAWLYQIVAYPEANGQMALAGG